MVLVRIHVAKNFCQFGVNNKYFPGQFSLSYGTKARIIMTTIWAANYHYHY
jgi:hypothetical protein